MPPETRYAQKGETSIAYQIVGDGPVDLVLVNGIVSHMSLLWGDPAANAFFRRLTSFSRLVLFDKPGTGRLIKTLGDGVLAAFEGLAKAIRCARAVCAEVRSLGS